MKRDKVSTFFKSKGFYVSLFTGIFAVFVLTMVYANMNSIKRQSQEDLSGKTESPGNLAEVNPVGESAIDRKSEGVHNLPSVNGTSVESDTSNDTSLDVAQAGDAGTENPQQETASSSGEDTDGQQPEQVAMTEETAMAEDSSIAQTQEPTLELAQNAELESEYGQVIPQEPDQAVEPVTSVAENQNILQNLHFQEEGGLLWPAEGSILKHYSMDKLVYFETLDQYKCNPAVLIGLEPGTEVLCGANGVVTAITQSEELGQSILVDIGDGYQIRYGQLTDARVQVGDLVEEGAVLACVAEPTIYYSMEGSNLYFQVLQNGETVNPLLLLR